MKKIQSLADELREHIRAKEKQPDAPPAEGQKNTAATEKRKAGSISSATEDLIKKISEHRIEGKEKLLIRLDNRTVFLLKQLKIASDIDMIQLISFALQDFIDKNPGLTEHIKKSLKSFEL
ncbi:MAG: hypothetical protein QHC79_25895 [Pseudosphingobacterium sp.]|nr:hypothetical protein [Pseudosphingobacterium sp.]